MNNLIPHFIEQNYLKKKFKGEIIALSIFVDIQGFTSLTENLMNHVREGIEILNRIINNLMEYLIDLIITVSSEIEILSGRES